MKNTQFQLAGTPVFSGRLFLFIFILCSCFSAILRASAGTIVQLTNDPTVEWDPAWSPDGTEIAFDSDRDGTRHVWAIRPDGTGLRRITPDAAPGSDASWSPDGNRLVYENSWGYFSIINRDGTGLVTLPTGGITPAWSPDGTRIAFAGGPAPEGWPHPGDIYVINTDGTNLTQLTFDAPGESCLETHPAWSPDGSEIAFVSNRGGDFDIWAIQPDGTGLRYITPVSSGDWAAEPAWSPDGQWISFEYTMCSILFYARNVWAVDPDGANLRRITLGGGWDGSWSPDGSSFAFTSDRAGSPDIWISDSNPPTPVVKIENVFINRGHGISSRGREYYGEDAWISVTDANGWDRISSITTLDPALQIRPGPEDMVSETRNDGMLLSEIYWQNKDWWDDPPLAPGSYTITAEDVDGYYDTLTTAAMPAAPDVPQVLNPSNNSVAADTTPTFTWESVPGAAYYCLCLQKAGDMSSPVWGQSTPGHITSVTYNSDGYAREAELAPGSRYLLQVAAFVPEDVRVSDARVSLWSFAARLSEFWTAPKPPPMTGVEGKIVYENWEYIPSELYQIDLVSPEQTPTPLYQGALCPHGGMAWSPDGSKIAFAAFHDNEWEWGAKDIYVMNADGTGIVNITNDSAADSAPHWSPDGQRIAYTSNTCFTPVPGSHYWGWGYGMELYTIKPDGTDRQRLTFFGTSAGIGEPRWSPDGSKLIFEYMPPGMDVMNIASIDPDGTGFTLLATGSWWDSGPRWSPDGSTITFRSERSNEIGDEVWYTELYRMDPDGSNINRLTYLEGTLTGYDWAPDGQRLVVSYTPHGTYVGSWGDPDLELYIISTNGIDFHRLTYNYFPDGNCDWWAPNTQTGSNVSNSIGDTTITFETVEGEGTTTAVVYDVPPGPEPTGFQFLGEYYDISTTATIQGTITIAIHYEDSEVPGAQESWLALLHYDEATGRWVDITTSIDTVNNIIYGETTHLSVFALSAPPQMIGFLPPINMDGSSIFKRRSTIPVKLRLFDVSGNPVTDAEIKLYLAKIDGTVTGAYEEAVSTNAPDAGNTFRYDSEEQQYIFNLGTRSLSTGTWRIKADLGGIVSLEADISLK